MRTYVYWCSMDRDIKSLVKLCKGCALAAKAPSIKFNPWLETDRSWSCLHIDFAGSLNVSYYLIIRGSFSKWPEILKCKKNNHRNSNWVSTFTTFGVPDCIISDNSTQFTSKEFKGFCKMFVVEHIKSAPYQPRSNGQAEHFMDTFKRALKYPSVGLQMQHCNSFYKCINLHQIKMHLQPWLQQKLCLHGK